MARWPFSLNKEPKEAYLKYKRGEIVEVEKDRRKELHEVVEEEEPRYMEPVDGISGPSPREEMEETQKKLERHRSFGGNIWMRLAVSFLSLLLVVAGVTFMGKYALAVIQQPVPEQAEQTEQSATEAPEVNFFVNLKSSLDNFWGNFGFDVGGEAEGDAGGAVEPEQPDLRFDVKAKEQVTFANELHEKIIRGYQVVGFDAARYSERKISLVSLTSDLNGEKLKLAPYQLQLEEKLGKEHPLYANLSSRLTGLLETIEVVSTSKRSQIIDETNARIDQENSLNQAYVEAFVSLLEQYGLTYSVLEGTVSY